MDILYDTVQGIPTKLYAAQNAWGTIVALHGFGGSKESRAIQGLAERVCSSGLNVLAFDLPAHGVRTDPTEALEAENCAKELLTIERCAASLGGKLFAFATSFGAMCLLQRLDRLPDNFSGIVLRVPAVNMSKSLLAIASRTTRDFSLEKARQDGFRLVLGREYIIPYPLYEQLVDMHCLRTSSAWNSSRILTVYAECDELVDPADTETFLRLNPDIGAFCVSKSTHRMPQPQHLAAALDKAAEFLLGYKE